MFLPRTAVFAPFSHDSQPHPHHHGARTPKPVLRKTGGAPASCLISMPGKTQQIFVAVLRGARVALHRHAQHAPARYWCPTRAPRRPCLAHRWSRASHAHPSSGARLPEACRSAAQARTSGPGAFASPPPLHHGLVELARMHAAHGAGVAVHGQRLHVAIPARAAEIAAVQLHGDQCGPRIGLDTYASTRRCTSLSTARPRRS